MRFFVNETISPMMFQVDQQYYVRRFNDADLNFDLSRGIQIIIKIDLQMSCG